MISALKELAGLEKKFLKSISRAADILRKVSKISAGELPRMSAKDIQRITDCVSEIRRLTTYANDIVNDVRMEDLIVASEIKSLFAKFDHLLPEAEDEEACLYSHEKLRTISALLADEKQGRQFGFVCKYRKPMREFIAEIALFKTGADEFNEWIHDMGHYLVQIDKIVPMPNANGAQMTIEDVHALEALFSGIKLMELGLQMSFRGDDSLLTFESESQSKPYEPYKVFDKLRHIYDEKGITWKHGDNPFWGKVAAAKGMEFAAMNLYTNAVKYLANFPGEKIVSTDFVQADDGLEIIISSYGPLPSESEEGNISRVPMFRAECAKLYKGTGRGLCRVRRICEAAGYRFSIAVKRDMTRYETFAPFEAHIFIPKRFQISDEEP